MLAASAGSTTSEYTYRHAVERLQAGGIESAPLDAACLMEAASGSPRWRFILDPDCPIPLSSSHRFESMCIRRLAREPIAYILGVKEFWSLPLTVSPDVLIPRPETETLVEAVLEKIGAECQVSSKERPDSETIHSTLNTQHSQPVIVDLGTGSGAIALALAVELPHALVYAIDRAPGACRIAGQNIEAMGMSNRVRCIQGDLLTPLRTIDAGGGCDVIVSNPPYIPSEACDALSPEIATYEPREAIDGGPDGLHFYRRIITETPAYLREGGWLAIEVGDGQAPVVMELIRTAGDFGPAEVRQDIAGRARAVLAMRRRKTHG